MQIAERFETTKGVDFHFDSHLKSMLLDLSHNLEYLSWGMATDSLLKEIGFGFYKISRISALLNLNLLNELALRGERDINLSIIRGKTPSHNLIDQWGAIINYLKLELSVARKKNLLKPTLMIISGKPGSFQFINSLPSYSVEFIISSDIKEFEKNGKRNYSCYIIDLDNPIDFPGNFNGLLNRINSRTSTPIAAISSNGAHVEDFENRIDGMFMSDSTFEQISTIISDKVFELEHYQHSLFIAGKDDSSFSDIKSHFQRNGIKVSHIEDFDSLYFRLLRDSPDILILGNIGNETVRNNFCKKIKKDKHFSEIDVLLILEGVGLNIQDLVFSYGADDYILAPPSANELYERIHKRLSVKSLIKSIEDFSLGISKPRAISKPVLTNIVEKYGSKAQTIEIGDPFDKEEESYKEKKIITPKVLIADDNPLSSRLLGRCFEKEGWQVKRVGNGEDVTCMLQEKRFHIVVMDLHLSFISGFEILLWIRKNGLNKYIKSIVLTAQDQKDTERRAFALGASDFMSKPFNPEEVTKRVKRFIPTLCEP